MSLFVTCECGLRFKTPEANAGRRALCPGCGRELIVPLLEPAEEVLYIRDEPVQPVVSGKALASLVAGALLPFACLSGLPAILLGRHALRDIDQSAGRLRGRGLAVAGIVLGLIGCAATILLLMPAIRSAREAARRAQCVGNLSQIGLAMHIYHGAHGYFPPAAITDRNGRPLLSWRVAILPHLDSSSLYNDFHLDEPWDSPHNLPLLARMPAIYACPSDTTRNPGLTGYQAVVGSATAFTPDFKPLRFEDFTDGLMNTLLVGESRQAVPWTKPDDLSFDTALPLFGLGSQHGYHDNGFNVLLADGSVRFLKKVIALNVLRALLTRNGGEVWCEG